MKNRNHLPKAILTAAALLLMLACNLFSPASGIDKHQLGTQIAQTLSAQITQAAGSATATSESFPGTPEPTATQRPTQTPIATWTAIPSNTPLPTPSPSVCNWAQFVKDVDLPDGAVLPAGARFAKIWRLRNIGTCTWTTDYSLFFVSGERMGAGNLIKLPRSVKPGEYVDLAVPMVAPQQPGTYLGNWQLRSANGELFGIGNAANRAFWVEVKVADFELAHYYDLVNHICEAKWRNQDGPIPCWGPASDKDGFVQLVETPHFEDGRIDNEPALWVHPQFTSNGWISGEFPALEIRKGDAFKTYIGCFYSNDACQVTYRLDYRDEGGDVKSLGSWTEVYDEEISKIEVDLTELAGHKISLILVVKAKGSFVDDNVFWFAPFVHGLSSVAVDR